MEIKLELPTAGREQDALGYRDEFREHDSELNGDGGLGKAEDYGNWVQEKLDWHKGLNVPEKFVPSSTYFAVRGSDDRVVGMIDLRHRLNEYLTKSWNGHIGYSVRPTERKKGYATEMLRLALEECVGRGISPVIVGCDADNIGSKKTILKHGGVLKHESVQDDKPHLGFEINLGGSS